jgi:hypothetical protein
MMIRVTVGTVVVTWSQEYGFTVAGGEALTEEIEPRIVEVPVLSLPAYTDRSIGSGIAVNAPVQLVPAPDSGALDDGDPDRTRDLSGEPIPTYVPPTAGGRCGVCNHPMHEPEMCSRSLNLDGKRVTCDCITPFPA